MLEFHKQNKISVAFYQLIFFNIFGASTFNQGRMLIFLCDQIRQSDNISGQCNLNLSNRMVTTGGN